MFLQKMLRTRGDGSFNFRMLISWHIISPLGGRGYMINWLPRLPYIVHKMRPLHSGRVDASRGDRGDGSYNFRMLIS